MAVTLRIVLLILPLIFLSMSANAATWPAFSCNDEGCLICEDCDKDGVCVCSEWLSYDEIINTLSVAVPGLSAQPSSKPKQEKGKDPVNVPLIDVITGAVDADKPETRSSVFWDCGAGKRQLCCVGKKGCRLMIKACNADPNTLGFFDGNANVGTCYRE